MASVPRGDHLARFHPPRGQRNALFWPGREVASFLIEVRLLGRSGRDLLTPSSSHFDPEPTGGRWPVEAGLPLQAGMTQAAVSRPSQATGGWHEAYRPAGPRDIERNVVPAIVVLAFGSGRSLERRRATVIQQRLSNLPFDPKGRQSSWS